MNALTVGMALLGVAMVSLAQVLFKLAAPAFNNPALRWLDRVFTPSLTAAIILYALATLLWLLVLNRTRLLAVYPIMASSYLLVPLLSWGILHEVPSWRTWVGSAAIVAGICIAAS
ncbi:MAG: EamA family transporter [Uliginosibacterium sp.]|nr:EamA family transporter [Uliginosibacterium sp.]